MGTPISCTKCSQVAGLIQKVSRNSSKVSSLRAAVLHAVLSFEVIIVTFCRSGNACARVQSTGGTESTGQRPDISEA